MDRTYINNIIECNEPHASLDSYYGPYKTVREALETLDSATVNGVNYTKRHVGLTVGISDGDNITEYWFQGGVDDRNLVEKCNGSSLPQGIKVVTFNKNGGDGAQNSVLTDTDSMVCLPECTLTKIGGTFVNWQYNGNDYSVGESITIGSNTQVKAIWSSSPTPTTGYTIAWDTLNTTITGECDGIAITNGQECPAGSTVVLVATPDTGYAFVSWANIPPTSVVTDNVMTIVMNNDISDIMAISSEIPVQQFTFTYTEQPVGVNTVRVVNRETGALVQSGTLLDEGTVVLVSLMLQSGYENMPIYWGDVPDGDIQVDQARAQAMITVNQDLNLTIAVSWDFYRYSCRYNAEPYFTDTTTDWVMAQQGHDLLNNNQYYATYVVTVADNAPLYTVNGQGSHRFEPLDAFIARDRNREIAEYFTNGVGANWVERGTHKTSGELRNMGNYIFILCDVDGSLRTQNIEIINQRHE